MLRPLPLLFLFFNLLILSTSTFTGSDGSASESPRNLRIDYTLVTSAIPLPFITLDKLTGNPLNISLTWELPPATNQMAYSVVVTNRNGAPAWSSGIILSTLPSASFSRSLLSPATGYVWNVSIQTTVSPSGSWLTSSSSSFFTSAGAQHWTVSEPIWAPSSDGSCGPTPNGTLPKFARFYTAIPLTTSPIESAFLYITGASPIYGDPWNTTKLLGGYSLRLGTTSSTSNQTEIGPIISVGPGRTACGPYAMGPCEPVQPYDGIDLTSVAQIIQESSTATLTLYIESYGLSQPDVGVAPAIQAVLVVRYVGNNPSPLIIGTSSSSNGPWSALNADAIRNPGNNKAPFWYFMPEEQVNASCQFLPSDTPPPPGSSCCLWTTPVSADEAWANGTVPLAGKTTQPLQTLTGVSPTNIIQLGPGWWVADMGGEHQGGIELQLIPSQTPQGTIPATLILVQLGEELASNGSALWNLRAGCKYRDHWHFPAATTGTPDHFLFASHHEYSEFRWVEIIILDAVTLEAVDIPLVAVNITGWTVRYPYADEYAASLTTASPELNAVWEFCAHTLKVTTLDFIADSNTRQRSIDCMADDTTAILSFYATTPELALPRMVMSQIMAIGSEGYLSPNWADWTILPALDIVYDAWMTGDFSLAEPLLDVLVANHTYLNLVNVSSGLIHNGPGLGALVDTSGGSDDDFHPSPWNAVVQAWCYLSITNIASLAAAMNRAATAAQLQTAATSLKMGFNQYFFNGTAICDGLCSDVPHTSVHSSFYALAFGLVDDTNAAAVWNYVQYRAFEDALGVPCGSYPVQFLLQALYANTSDHGTAAYNVLTSVAPHSWLNMMNTWDATATMECWLPSELPNLSFSHVWSSSPSFIIPRYFFGLQITAPGVTSVSIRPQPGPVLTGQGTFPTVRGPVSIAFRQTQPTGSGNPPGCFELQTTTPGGVVLRAYLPLYGANPKQVNVTVDGGAPVSSPVVEGDYVYIDGLVSGTHTVTTC